MIKEELNIIKWDGSDISKHIEEKVINIKKYEYEKQEFWSLEINNVYNYCQVRKIKNYLPVLIDEIKPFFNISRNKNHTYKNKKIIYLLTKVKKKGELFDNGISLKCVDFKLQDKILFKIQTVFAFRQLLSITKTYLNSIRVYPDKLKVLSYYEPNININDNKDVISRANMKTYFENHNIYPYNILKTCFDIKSSPNKITSKFGEFIEKIINRIDKSLIHYKSFIIERLLLIYQ